MTTVAIHQPNYMPWLGYFYKLARCDVFIFLDDVQYSKNSYINRTRILGSEEPRWLTVPVSYRFGDPICQVRPSEPDWRARHLDILTAHYRSAPWFQRAWPKIQELYEPIPDTTLASINRGLVEELARLLGISRRFVASSQFDTTGLSGDDRLVALVRAIDEGGAYLSGRGGANYQDASKFPMSGLTLRFTDFQHPIYDQKRAAFTAGLSVLDAVFHLGWGGAADLIAERVDRG